MNKNPNFATDNRDGYIVPENVPDTNVGKINGRTPDEIKKGLEVCATLDGDCENCPYDDGKQLTCVDRSRRDALAYIIQLETSLAQVERENKAMLHDMARYTMCGSCKHFSDREKCPQHDKCVYGEIGHFEWRGVCEENTKEKETHQEGEIR